jgi:hypothetical protein
MCVGLLVQILMKRIFSADFRKIFKNQFSLKSFFHVDGWRDRQTNKQIQRQADMTNCIVDFHDFVKAHKIDVV